MMDYQVHNNEKAWRGYMAMEAIQLRASINLVGEVIALGLVIYLVSTKYFYIALGCAAGLALYRHWRLKRQSAFMLNILKVIENDPEINS